MKPQLKQLSYMWERKSWWNSVEVKGRVMVEIKCPTEMMAACDDINTLNSLTLWHLGDNLYCVCVCPGDKQASAV